ncbi:MAG: hypothetical protein B7Z80_09345 [Rhodospirillales bacterium 20-64-7]|jgi:flagellar biosynthetic protein FliQ|nr:MAG: hypothetical protein B7Z80_09345 [Rhodospirillales bacterium 20-64-7]
MPPYLLLLHQALGTTLAAIWPVVALLLAVGLATAILQSALQIEDATFSLLPKTIAMIAIGLTGGFGALGMFETLAIRFILHAPALAHQPWH